MGFTHYFKHSRNIPQVKWDTFVKDVKLTLVGSEKTIQLDYDDTKPPLIDKDAVIFNGIEGCEDFYLTRKDQSELCKTARKPYDKYVVAVLMLAKMHFGTRIKFSSDGDPDDLIEGQSLMLFHDQLNIKTEIVTKIVNGITIVVEVNKL